MGTKRIAFNRNMNTIQSYLVTLALCLGTLSTAFANPLSGNDSTLRTTGVSVSPSRLRMNAAPGETVIQRIKIHNDTDQPNSFKLEFQDFDMNGTGKSSFLAPGEGRFSLARWATISPSFVDLAPGEKTEVTLTVSLPNSEEAQRAAWSILMIEQAAEKRKLDLPEPGKENVAFGIIPTFAFGVFLYQNPPNVSNNRVEITDFRLDPQDKKGPVIDFKVENQGDGIAYCSSYVELTDLNTGRERKLPVKQFTILPELIREFRFALPEDLSPGRYSAVGVLDFGHREEIQAAELEFEIAK
jgi:hypothetical protein